MRLRSAPEFIALNLDSQPACLDRPKAYRFQIPFSRLERTPTTLQLAAGELQFSGQTEGEKIAGWVEDQGGPGTFELWPVSPQSAQGYPDLIGYYQLPQGGTLYFTWNWSEESSIYFYLEGDRIVRLYPTGSDRWLSERCEIICVHRGAGDTPASLIFEAPSRPLVQATRAIRQVEEAVSIPMEGYQLAGTLLKPLGPGPFPAVVVCHGAGLHQRDIYRIYIQSFVEKGIAALVYDKRGRGASTGEPQFSDIFPLADDAVGVYNYLQRHPDIRKEAIGFWGISNGGWVGPMAAARVEDPAFVVLTSASGVSPGRQEQIRRANVAQELGASPHGVALVERLWGLMFKYYADGLWSDELEQVLTQVYEDDELQRLPRYPGLDDGLQSVPPRIPFEELKRDAPGSYPMGVFDPFPLYLELSCPLLFVWGGQDNVIPLEESLKQAREALRQRGNPQDAIKIYPNGDHLLYQVTREPVGMLAAVMVMEAHNACFVPDVREDMAEWAAGVLGKTA